MKSLVLLILAGMTIIGCAADDLYEIEIGEVRVSAEVVDTDESRARGLMFRESMPETQGMLFVFDEAAPRAFYMKNTSIPLSIAYIDERLVIREIYDMHPFSLESIHSTTSAMYALEMNQGAYDRLGVRPGDRLVLSERLISRIGR